MCGGGGADTGAAEAAAREAERQAKITQGTAAIDRIFGGYKKPVGAVSGTPDPTGTYYLEDGSPVTINPGQVSSPITRFGNATTDFEFRDGKYYVKGQDNPLVGNPADYGLEGGGATMSVPSLWANGKNVGAVGSAPLYTGFENVPGFDDNFYATRENAFVQNAMPQLEDKYADAKKQILFALQRKGLSSSTAAGQEQARLENQFNQYRTDISSKAKQYTQGVRGDIENSRNQLINQLIATENPAMAATGAVRAAEAASAPPAFDPIGSFVFDVSEGLRQAAPVTGAKGLFSPALFQSGSSKGGSVTYRN